MFLYTNFCFIITRRHRVCSTIFSKSALNYNEKFGLSYEQYYTNNKSEMDRLITRTRCGIHQQ